MTPIEKIKIEELGQRALKHITYLVEKIGSRPAGSDAEHQAQDYISDQLTRWGYQVQKQPVDFAPLPAFFAGYALVGLLIGFTAWWISSYPFFTIWMPVFLVLVSTYARLAVNRRHCSEHSLNVFAYSSENEYLPTIILCAHLDTARSTTFHHKYLRLINYYTIYVLQRLAIAVFLLSFFIILGLFFPVWLYIFVGSITSLVGFWLAITQIRNQFFHHNIFSPGANDNASGVGVLLSLAEYFAKEVSYSGLRLCFLFTTAEEMSLSGSQEFAHSFISQDHKLPGIKNMTLQRIMLNIDMVGAGNIVSIVEGEGMIFPSRTDKRLNQILNHISPEINRIWYDTRTGDFVNFTKVGIPSVSLQITGSLNSELTNHTIDDRMDIIEKSALEITIGVVIKFIDQLRNTIKTD